MNPQQKTIFYVTRDIERALGMEPNPNYQIITGTSTYALEQKELYPSFIHIVDKEHPGLETHEILGLEETKKILPPQANIVVFKNNPTIEEICQKNNWRLLNPASALSEKIENKISQFDWLGQMTEFLPESKLQNVSEINFADKTIVVQWAHSHTGDGTILLKKAAELEELKKKFPQRPARVSRYVNGSSFTVNVLVDGKKTLTGNISYQITGLPPFTDNLFSTIGNDWSLTHSLLSEKDLEFIEKICQKIGELMNHSGWKGLFGLDFIKDEESNKIFIIEINARQPASTTFESELQKNNRNEGLVGLTTFEAHLMALCNQEIKQNLIQINDGAQIIQRLTKNKNSIKADELLSLRQSGFECITYENNHQPNSDLLRIKSNRGIMESHNKFNSRGKDIAKYLNTEIK